MGKGMKQEKIGIGTVGCGYWGPNLIRNFHSLPGSRAVKACDLDPAQLERVAVRHPGIEITTEFSDLVDDPRVQAVVIATPVRTHFELARKSLMAGKHTLVEKPMAASSDQCRELIALAEERNLILMVGHTFIYSTPVRRIKEIVDSGEIGELIYISSSRLNLGLYQSDINVAWDLAPHDISIILYVVGRRPVSVNCRGKAHLKPGIEDVVHMTLDFANGGFSSITNSWLDPNKVRRMTFVGSRKMILYDDTEPLEKIKIYDKRVEIPPRYDTFGEFQFSYHYGDTYAPHLQQAEPLKVQCRHFLECIRTGKNPLTSGREGLEVVRILEAADDSLKGHGGSVEIQWDAEQTPGGRWSRSAA